MADKPPKSSKAKSKTMRDLAASTDPGAKKTRRLRQTAGKLKPAAVPFQKVGRFGRRLSRFIVPPYFRNSWRELKRVTWPSRKETWQLTFAVFVFAIVFAALVSITDYGLDKVFKRILIKQ